MMVFKLCEKGGQIIDLIEYGPFPSKLVPSDKSTFINNMYVYNVHVPAMTHSVIASLTAL